MEEAEKPDVGVDTLYAVGDRDTKELHFQYKTDVLLSDDKQKLLGIIRILFGTGYDDEVVEATVEELRSLIHTQWNSSKRFSVTIESDTMEKGARWALEEYLTTPPPLEMGGL
jgi:galactokinase/mevalonate kinase-like predicted kinase